MCRYNDAERILILIMASWYDITLLGCQCMLLVILTTAHPISCSKIYQQTACLPTCTLFRGIYIVRGFVLFLGSWVLTSFFAFVLGVYTLEMIVEHKFQIRVIQWRDIFCRASCTLSAVWPGYFRKVAPPSC